STNLHPPGRAARSCAARVDPQRSRIQCRRGPPMKLLLIPMGTPGDVQPFIELAAALNARGHEATVAAHDNFRDWIERRGGHFISLGSADDYARFLADANLWNLHKAPRVFASKLVRPTFERMYELVKKAHESGTLVVAQTMALAARVAADTLGARVVMLHRQPSIIHSAIDPPTLPMTWMPPG